MADTVLVCPKCKSPDIYRDQSTKLTGALGLPSMYVCNNCGYSSHVFIEVDKKEVKGFEKEVKKKELVKKDEKKSELVDKSYGKGIVRGYWKILGPLTLLFGIAFFFTALPAYGFYLLIVGIIISYFSFRK